MPPRGAPKEEINKAITGEIIALLAGLFLLSIIAARIALYLADWGTGWQDIWFHIRDFFIYVVWPWIQNLAILVSALSIIVIVYSSMKLSEIATEEKEIYKPSKKITTDEGVTLTKNGKWLTVLEHINSPNASDWRLAIIEADIMLDEVLRAKGYHGDTVGDMLKSVDKSDMLSLEAAWEAHKVRNKVAHSGSSFPINDREAKRTITLYETVFKEFGII